DMLSKIKKYAQKTGQPIPKTDGEFFRIIYESLALKYRYVFEEISDCVGKQFKQVHIVGGGSQAEILCQMVANASNKEVLAGPVEATVIGNSAVQLLSQNAIDSVSAGRDVVKRSFELKSYHPEHYEKWNAQYDHFKRI